MPVTHDPDQYSTDFGKALKQIRAYGTCAGESFVPVDVPAKEPEDTSAYDFGDTPDYGAVGEVLVLSGIGGRVDQGLGLLHEIAREQGRWPAVRIVLISDSSVSFVLGGTMSEEGGADAPLPAADVVHMSPADGTPGAWRKILVKNMGIVPVFGPSRIWTKGLEWDVEDWSTEMGKMVSTSNHVVEDVVEVRSTARVLFTIERLPVEEEAPTPDLTASLRRMLLGSS